MTRYLTKSRFKIALECPPKLFYCNKEDEYADSELDDPFLAALAAGGFQVGELAKFMFCQDPVREQITVMEKDHDKALTITKERLFSTESPVIAEAAFRFENLFVRVDITTRTGRRIDIYEVKAKSWDSGKKFWKTTRQGETNLERGWLPYLYDIAFQKWVVSNAYPEYNINAHMIFADKDVAITINGLNQLFRINEDDGKTAIRIQDGLTEEKLGKIPLKILPVDQECEWIYTHPVDVDLPDNYSFEQVVKLFSDCYEKNERIWSPIGVKCKGCQFVNTDSDPKLKSGFHECWKHWTNLGDEDLSRPLALELWGGLAGSKSLVDEAIKEKKYLLSSLDASRFWPNVIGQNARLQPGERRKLQVMKVQQSDYTPYLDKIGLKKVFQQYPSPYHFIDFETCMVALPFHLGRKPYEAIAFQYSYHLMDDSGAIEHKNQFIALSPEFPNYDFVRALKRDLQGVHGTIFRYHKHENNYLNFIRKQLMSELPGTVPDRDELIEFILEVTHDRGEGRVGKKDMIDLWELVLGYYYSPVAKGSNSIKEVLPAVIHDSNYIKDKYSEPIYGTPEIPSLNFQNHTWISANHEMNPYNTLPNVLEGYDNDQLDQFAPGVDEVKDGGAAMMAYAYMQFTDVSQLQKDAIKDALFRYCELDTMAMVMIWEYWGNEIGWFH